MAFADRIKRRECVVRSVVFFLVFFSSQSSTSVIISGDKDRAIISHRPRLLYTRSVLQNLRGQEI